MDATDRAPRRARALAPVLAPHLTAEGVTNLHASPITTEREALGAVVHPRGTLTVPLVLVPALPSGQGAAYRPGGDPRVTSVEGLGTPAGGAAGLEATQCGPAARGRERFLVHVLHHTPLIRGTAGAELALGQSVGEGGVTAGTISEIVGRGLQYKIAIYLGIRLQLS
ncbi:hypothetical protein BV22DRAFT_1028779 [Leucogyrophana mollusca]|uniref:Uncharacterized protein n=1 Tax=Leucogyrophana mollusca TaxID=85980 RepID=A0ACB8BYV0_9AGAM|nr:hypothetical protein BV22DRAFT_1028779 [Leucogyrophana mollusca]